MLLALAILSFFVAAGMLVFLFDGFFGKLAFPSSSAAAGQIIMLIRQKHLENGNFIDLGSAYGRFAVKIAKAFPGMKVLGVDDNGLRIICAKARSIFLKNIQFKILKIYSRKIVKLIYHYYTF